MILIRNYDISRLYYTDYTVIPPSIKFFAKFVQLINAISKDLISLQTSFTEDYSGFLKLLINNPKEIMKRNANILLQIRKLRLRRVEVC